MYFALIALYLGSAIALLTIAENGIQGSEDCSKYSETPPPPKILV